MAGYSATPLAKKLGLKDGFIIRLINEPPYYFSLFSDVPKNLVISTDQTSRKNFIHLFATRASEIRGHLPALSGEIEPNGIIWVSWYKRSSKIPTDVTEQLIRELAIANGLVDVKVCAVDD